MKTPSQFNGVTGSTADILSVMFGAPQQDGHVGKWRWHLRLVDAARRSDAVSAEVDRINAAYRARLGRPNIGSGS